MSVLDQFRIAEEALTERLGDFLYELATTPMSGTFPYEPR